jgi:transcriptional regulator with XRE-family HTH domain
MGNSTITMTNLTVQHQMASFGARLRELRLGRGWTLEDLAQQSGLSKPFLSRLESGDRQASISAVLTLSQIFGVSLASMFETAPALEPCLLVRGAEVPAQESHGLTYWPLSSATHLFTLRPMRLTISTRRNGSQHYQHDGEEWIYVLSGKVTLSLDGKSYNLDEGDAIHFDSRLPHRLSARGRSDAEILLVAGPASLERSGSGSLRALPAKDRRAIPSLPAVGRLSSPSI